MTLGVDILERICIHMDCIRQRFYRKFMPLFRSLIIDRDKRIGIGGSLLFSISLVLTLFSPLWLLALGPIILGIPHLLADVLYLGVRQNFYRNTKVLICCGIPLIMISFGASMLWGFAGCFTLVMLLNGSTKRKAGIVFVICLLALLSVKAGNLAALIFAHLHNFIAVLIWWFWRKQRDGVSVLPLFVFLFFNFLIISGSLDFFIVFTNSLNFFPGDMDLNYYAEALAPGLSGNAAIRLVLMFAFAQSVHYAIWIRLIPDEDHIQKTPRSFKNTYHSLSSELGKLTIWIAVIACIVLAIWAVFDLKEARSGYLRMALFHGYLELYALTYLALKGNLNIARESQT